MAKAATAPRKPPTCMPAAALTVCTAGVLADEEVLEAVARVLRVGITTVVAFLIGAGEPLGRTAPELIGIETTVLMELVALAEEMMLERTLETAELDATAEEEAGAGVEDAATLELAELLKLGLEIPN